MIWKWIILTTVLLVISSFVLLQYSDVEIYMDELFHIPQAKHYCNGEFHIWNKGITTYPGLYVVSYAVHKLIEIIQLNTCSVYFLRAINMSISCILPILFYQCRKMISPSSKDHWILAFILYLYPLNFFYYFLYYTDTLSTASLALAYYLNLRYANGSPGSSSSAGIRGQLVLFLASCMCVLARQTNAVWLMFMAGTSMLRALTASGYYVDTTLTLAQIGKFVSALWQYKLTLLWKTWPLLVPVIVFAGYVIKTGSIVLGDKENHQPVLHFAMLAHALVLISAILAPTIIYEVYTTTTTGSSTEKTLDQVSIDKKKGKGLVSSTNWYTTFVYALIGLWAAWALVQSSYSHPFLLSDNRHYMFYVWQRALSSETMRLYLSPVYAIGAIHTVYRLSRRQGPAWVLIFLVALTLTLVPTPLLEPRYFSPGVVLALLHSPALPTSTTAGICSCALTICAMIVVNAITMYIFLTHTYVWNDGSIARFMY